MRIRYIGLIFVVSIALLGLVAVQSIGAQAPAPAAGAGGQGAPAGAADVVVAGVAVLLPRRIQLRSCAAQTVNRI
jgi:hypothetical protein